MAGLVGGSVAWGDYDNDGDLDILLTGADTLTSRVSKIYRNDGGIFTDIGASLIDLRNSSAAWGDYDNDGDLDILLTGYTGPQVGVTFFSKIYRNDGGTFTDTGISLTGVANGSVAWGDYDNDGDLDILLTGSANGQYVSKIYRNDGGGVDFSLNTPPTAPTGLQSYLYVLNDQMVLLLWDAASDAQTPPAGLTYNIRVGTVADGVDTVSPMADGSTGWRMIPAMGRTGHRQFAILEIDPDKEYYWSVQAVDTAFEGSAWSSESFFTARKTLTVVTAGSGSGTVTSNPTGIDCGVDCSENFAKGDTVTLTAVADAGSTFTGWWGGGCSGTGDCTVTISEVTTVAAVFETAGTNTSTTSGSGGGGGGGCFVDTIFSGWRWWDTY